ncbi:Aste57867_8133 [Aphanomyces stellatus]|uniref:Aste57867_8133 protein n=1 Tax=Aphanomyces stellatus TaxID=120398 RepID=A0A485KJF8_9STRA|nr:hypothetical protein As57867_008103 [Aphanomyces stellatus]VFT85022.1 Aste57867_8133 [Aphanomyces stellatus]
MYATADTRTWKFMKMVSLKENVTSLNFIAFIFAAALSICMFVFLSSTQGFVLNQILRVDLGTIGNISGNLTLFDECIALVMVYVWGILSDRWGRGGIYGVGFLLMGIGLVLYPFSKHLSPDLIIYRGIFSLGGSATSSMLTAVLADYSSEKDRGKVSGLVGLMSGIGALLAVFFFLPMPAKYTDQVKGLKIAYSTVAGVSALFGIFLIFALRPKKMGGAGPSDHLITTPTDHAVPTVEKVSMLGGLKAGFLAAKDGKVLLGYIGGFLARGDTIIITIYLPLWVYKYYVENKLCDRADPSSPTVKTDCHDAYIKASILSGVAQTAAMVSAPLFGWLGDRFYRPVVVLAASIIGLVSYFWLFLCTDPTAKVLYVVAILVGVGEMGIVVSSMSVVTSKAIPSHLRGSVSGAYAFCGTIGIMIASKLGGYLFDAWTSTAPFFVMAVGNVIAVVAAVVVIVQDYAAVKHRVKDEATPLLVALKQAQLDQDEMQLGI